MTIGAIALLAWLSARRTWAPAGPDRVRPSRRPFGLRFGSPVLTEGVRAAYHQRSSVPVVVGTTVATTTMAAALSFGGSLSALVSTPESYGWPWDVAAMTGGGYGGLDIERAGSCSSRILTSANGPRSAS